MDLNKLINETIIHKTFGNGLVLSWDEKYLEVKFAQKDKTSKFQYPSCFNGFMQVENADLQAEIDIDVKAWKQENDIELKEGLKKRYEKTVMAIEARRHAAEEKKQIAAQRAMEHRSAYSHVNQAKKTN